MREISAIVGSLLVASGAIGPAALQTGDQLFAGPVEGEATFAEANYTGPSNVTANEAALRMEGRFNTNITSPEATVTVYRWENVAVNATDPVTGAGVKWDGGTEQDWSRDRYQNVSVTIQGNREGVLRAWPNETIGSATLSVSLGTQDPPTIDGSAKGIGLWTDDSRYQYELDGPIYALGQHTDGYHRVQPRKGDFESIQASGDLDLIVQHGSITIGDGEGRSSYQADREETVGQRQEAVQVSDRSYAVVTVENGHLSIDAADLPTMVFLREPTWRINGTIQFHAQQGEVRTGSENESLTNDPLLFKGRSTLHLQAQGPQDERNETEPVGDHRLLSEPVLPSPKTKASFQGDADEVRIDGKSIEVPASPAIPEEVTFWGKIAGLALVALSLLKKLTSFLAALVIRKPLDNNRRRRIYEHLKKEGLAHVRHLERALNVPASSIAYHLRVLEEHNLVSSVEHGKYTVYFLSDTDLDPEERERLAGLAIRTRREIAARITEQPGLTQSCLLEALDIVQSTASRHLSQLVDAGLVKREGVHRIEYRPADLLEKWFSIQQDEGDGGQASQ